MDILKQAAQQALEAIDYLDVHPEGGIDEAKTGIEVLRDALAQPEPAGAEDMKVYAAIAEGYGRLEKRLGCVQHDCDVCRAALAQPEQEQKPIAWLSNDGNVLFGAGPKSKYIHPLYKRPQASSKPLTDEDLRKLADKHLFYQTKGYEVSGIYDFARAIEAAHGIGGEHES